MDVLLLYVCVSVLGGDMWGQGKESRQSKNQEEEEDVCFGGDKAIDHGYINEWVDE